MEEDEVGVLSEALVDKEGVTAKTKGEGDEDSADKESAKTKDSEEGTGQVKVEVKTTGGAVKVKVPGVE